MMIPVPMYHILFDQTTKLLYVHPNFDITNLDIVNFVI